MSGVKPITGEAQSRQAQVEYDYRYGETDLFEPNLRRTGQVYLLSGLMALAALMVAAFFAIAGPYLFHSPPETPDSANPAVSPPSPRPTLLLATVTPAPPTRTPTPSPTLSPTVTITPTREPCIQKVEAGDDLITLAARCGHRSLDVLSVILEINNLEDAARIQIGQVIEIPWPTPTVDPNVVPTETPAGESGGDPLAAVSAGTVSGEALAFDPFGPSPTKTLQPGVIWHEVKSQENIISIALQYGANVEILSQLNPEVTFAQCDFGLDSGGGSCTVFLYEGQLLRVPAPTVTPTLSPTPSGSETATPTLTATFNAPSPISPTDRAFFASDEIVTLRWVASGSLTAGQTYRVQVTNKTTGATYAADTMTLFFIVPGDWQAADNQRHEYEWQVSLIDTDRPDKPYFTTQALTFIWQGRN